MANIKEAAKKVKKAGQRLAPEDSILAHITPEEAMQLRLMGGSGEVDPKTGLPHFAQDRGDENDGNEGNDNEGGDGDGGENEGSDRPDRGSKSLGNFGDKPSSVESDRDAVAESADALGGDDTAKDSLREARTRDGSKNPPVPGPLNQRETQQAAFGTDANLPQRLLDAQDPTKTKTTTETDISLGGLLGAGASLLTGNLPGLVGSLSKGTKKHDHLDNIMPDTASDFAKPGLDGAGRDRNDKDPVVKPPKPAAAPTPAEVPVTPEDDTVAGDIDSFTRGARKKKGLGSTIVSGGMGGSGITTGKSLLGM